MEAVIERERLLLSEKGTIKAHGRCSIATSRPFGADYSPPAIFTDRL